VEGKHILDPRIFRRYGVDRDCGTQRALLGGN
jgi:hypothetical protein